MPEPVIMTRLVRGRPPGREFDIAFWQAAGPTRFRARLGNLWVAGGSAQRLSEEAVELAAGGVKGALLVFPAVVN
jgi:hypothetical protein